MTTPASILNTAAQARTLAPRDLVPATPRTMYAVGQWPDGEPTTRPLRLTLDPDHGTYTTNTHEAPAGCASVDWHHDTAVIDPTPFGPAFHAETVRADLPDEPLPCWQAWSPALAGLTWIWYGGEYVEVHTDPARGAHFVSPAAAIDVLNVWDHGTDAARIGHYRDSLAEYLAEHYADPENVAALADTLDNL